MIITMVFFTSPLVYKAPYLLVYCESALEVYEVTTGKWVQTIPFRKVLRGGVSVGVAVIPEQFIKYQLSSQKLKMICSKQPGPV